MTQDKESQLIKLCQTGEIKNFEGLYEIYIDKIYKYVYYKTLDKETSQDITSETFLKALEKISTFDSSRGNFSMWIYTIARNIIADHYKQYKNIQHELDVWDLEISSDENIIENISNKNLFESLSVYLKELKPHEREILFLRIWEDLPFREIALVQDKTEAAVKMSFKRAIESLKNKVPLNLLFIILIKSI